MSRAAAPKRSRVHGALAREIGLAIVSGRLRPGLVLDREVDASSRRHVSRTAYREAMRSLAAKGLIQSRPRTGTRVSNAADWHLLDPDVLEWMLSATPSAEMLHGLVELRAIIEPEAAALAAARRNEADLGDMRRALDVMASRRARKRERAQASQSFHAALLASTRNAFVMSLTNGVVAALPGRNLVNEHLRVYDAVAAKDASGARAAMLTLIRCEHAR